MLQQAFRRHALDLAGPQIAFDSEPAFLSAATLADACWQLVTPEPDVSPPPGRLSVPRFPYCHLSADVMLRFLPGVRRLSRPKGEDDPLAKWTADLLSRWPLSGVLTGLSTKPAPLDFGGHIGLSIRYAERLVENPVAAWVPLDRVNREQVERVFHQRGKPVPVVPASEVSA